MVASANFNLFQNGTLVKPKQLIFACLKAFREWGALEVATLEVGDLQIFQLPYVYSIRLSGPSYRLRTHKLEWDEPAVKEG